MLLLLLSHSLTHHLVDEELHFLHAVAEAASSDLRALGVQHHCAHVRITVH